MVLLYMDIPLQDTVLHGAPLHGYSATGYSATWFSSAWIFRYVFSNVANEILYEEVGVCRSALNAPHHAPLS